MRFTKRYQLVANLAAAQLFCLGWGVFFFGMWLHAIVESTLHQQILADNVQTAKQLSTLVREMRIGDVRSDPQAWDRMQSLVRDIRLPNDGYVCLSDADSGEMICHPSFQSQPSLLPREEWATSGVSAASITGGIVGEGGGLEIVAAATIPSLHAKLMVHQRGAGITRAVNRFTAPILPIGLLFVVGLVATTSFALLGVIRRYDDRMARINKRLEDRVGRRTRTLRRMRDAVVFGLAKLAESRDTDTGEHLERIRAYVTILAEQLRSDGIEIQRREVEGLALASSLHDIGKVGVPDRVLLKPGRLDDPERVEMETHAALGGDCLAAISDRLGEDDFLQYAKEIAYHHHEKWDGSGYPDGLVGAMIPLSARIVAVADVYDALRSRRPYKDPMPHEMARQILLEGRGTHFDPVLIEAFLACEDRFIEVSERSNSASLRDHAGVEDLIAEQAAVAAS